MKLWQTIRDEYVRMSLVPLFLMEGRLHDGLLGVEDELLKLSGSRQATGSRRCAVYISRRVQVQIWSRRHLRRVTIL